jgi:membrane associated rhomboid family serine protease
MRTPDSWQTARATVVIAVATFIIYLVLSVFQIEGAAIDYGAFVPIDLQMDFGFDRAPFFLTPLTATLLHGTLWHLAFNLLIFAFCGRAVEGALGPANLVILYVVGAYAAAAGHYIAEPGSMVPMIGASGAISAVIGAYAMLFGKNRVQVANANLALWLNVLWLLAAWIVLQVAMGIVFSAGSGILLAVGAHIGGFLAGVILARPLLLWRYRRA